MPDLVAVITAELERQDMFVTTETGDYQPVRRGVRGRAPGRLLAHMSDDEGSLDVQELVDAIADALGKAP